MEFTQDPSESAPVRRKPRARAPKVTPTEEVYPSAPVSDEIQDFAQAEEILNIPEETVPSREPGIFARLDLAMPVLAVAFVLFLFSQILALRQTASAMTWRVETLDRQAVTLKGVRNNAADLFKQRQGLVEETQRVSNNYNAFLTELLNLAETDRDARSVVEKFNIKNAAPAQPASAAKK
jgi:uncharacterized protein YoxC